MGLLDLFRKPKDEDPDEPSTSQVSGSTHDSSDAVVTPSGMDPDMLASIADLLDKSTTSGGSGSEKTSYIDKYGDKTPSGSSGIEDVGLSSPQPEPEPEPEPVPEPEPPASDTPGDTASLIDFSKEPAPEAVGDPDEELLSAIAALIGQGDDVTPVDPKPTQTFQPDPTPVSQVEPKPASPQSTTSDDAVNDDLLSAIAELMWQGESDQGGSNTGGSSSEPKEPQVAEIKPIDPAVAEKFWGLYEESLHLKDSGKLASADAKRKEGYDISDPYDGLRGMACHNIAILSMYHLGNGREAARYIRESLECGEAYRKYSEESLDIIQLGAHFESLQVAVYTSSSYDEAQRYIEEGVKLYGEAFEKMRAEIAGFSQKSPRIYDYQRAGSLQYYSRVSAEQDKGDYAPGMALLQLILDRAEEPGYDLSHEEFVDALDDYGTISIMYLLQKAQTKGFSQDEFAQELAFIADDPLKRIADFLPNCQPSERALFDRIVQGFKMLPGVAQRDAFAPFR